MQYFFLLARASVTLIGSTSQFKQYIVTRLDLSRLAKVEIYRPVYIQSWILQDYIPIVQLLLHRSLGLFRDGFLWIPFVPY